MYPFWSSHWEELMQTEICRTVHLFQKDKELKCLRNSPSEIPHAPDLCFKVTISKMVSENMGFIVISSGKKKKQTPTFLHSSLERLPQLKYWTEDYQGNQGHYDQLILITRFSPQQLIHSTICYAPLP